MTEMDFSGMSRDEVEEMLRHKIRSGIELNFLWDIELLDGETGERRWRNKNLNVVTNEGLNRILDILFGSTAKDGNLYIGLKDGTAPAAGDTMTEAAAYEVTSYDEAARQAFNAGSASGQSIDNSASKAQFTLSASVTIGGGFLTNDNTKGGTTGELYSSEDFTGGDRSGQDGDIVQVTLTISASDA